MAYSVRDILGHFVKPRSAKGKMCPHACCRNKRVHPENMPVILPNKLLRRASDEDLAEHYRRLGHGHTAKDERGRAQVLHEMERRDNEARRREAIENTRAAQRQEREAAVEDVFVRAEAATAGNLVNVKGRARGIDPRRLITGREADFRRYASDEALEYFATHHRPTAASFRGADTRVAPKATEPKRRQWTNRKTGAGYVRR